ncbi:hypothetical protein BDB00DRAFT_879245 [Zychaea mexicana]|uniref:uncharacterized protein n=1 Tax=Zychaea mexicana TaxID=64656 RepID=UPI0022FF2891|nr:uncharacterized protein BDB00DRAFT_879245 [Zychaea mexicana]KAI9479599.1 hypothetical protein BDB00DRAFT_879245 [Zychaea mexicana]
MVTEYISKAKNAYYGKFATTSRLIMCLILEGYVTAYFIDEPDRTVDIAGVCLVLRRVSDPATSIVIDDIHAIVPLRATPELSASAGETIILNGKDGTDDSAMVADSSAFIKNSGGTRTHILNVLHKLGLEKEGSKIALSNGYTAVQLWHRFAYENDIHKSTAEEIESELASSIELQTYSYNFPKPCPTLQSSSVEWEQANLEAKIHHAVHKSLAIGDPAMRRLMLDRDSLEPLLDRPTIRLAAIPKDDMQVCGNFEEIAAPLVNAILAKTGDTCGQRTKYTGHLLLPIHELQIPMIEQKIKGAEVLPEANHVTASALTSMRTVALPGILESTTVKLCLGIRTTFKLNTIMPQEVAFGPAFSKIVIPRLSYDRDILMIQAELASTYHLDPNVDIAKHCACIIRRSIEFPGNGQSVGDDLFAVGSSLVEKAQRPDTDEILVTYAWNLDTEAKRAKFLDRYIRLLLKAFIPPCRDNGLTFEAHLQNVVARFDRSTGKLKGFLVRDLGGIDAHYETIKKSCGIDLKALTITGFGGVDSMENVYRKFYYTLFYLHLQPLIHRLGMHHNGYGWQRVRVYFRQLVPINHPMYQYFMEQEKIPTKCCLRSKIGNAGPKGIYRPMLNLVLSRPRDHHYLEETH